MTRFEARPRQRAVPASTGHASTTRLVRPWTYTAGGSAWPPNWIRFTSGNTNMRRRGPRSPPKGRGAVLDHQPDRRRWADGDLSVTFEGARAGGQLAERGRIPGFAHPRSTARGCTEYGPVTARRIQRSTVTTAGGSHHTSVGAPRIPSSDGISTRLAGDNCQPSRLYDLRLEYGHAGAWRRTRGCAGWRYMPARPGPQGSVLRTGRRALARGP